jgi:hypothetical protein
VQHPEQLGPALRLHHPPRSFCSLRAEQVPIRNDITDRFVDV